MPVTNWFKIGTSPPIWRKRATILSSGYSTCSNFILPNYFRILNDSHKLFDFDSR